MLLELAFHRFKSLDADAIFHKNSYNNQFARHTSYVLPSFRSNYRDSAQTCPRRARFFARTLENEEPLTGTHIPTCRPWGWFSMNSRGEHGLYPRRGRGEKSASRGEVMEPTYSAQKLLSWEQRRRRWSIRSIEGGSENRRKVERKIDTKLDSFTK